MCPTQEGSTAVMVAAAKGHASIVEQLINAGGNPNPHTTVDQSVLALLKKFWIVFVVLPGWVECSALCVQTETHRGGSGASTYGS